MIDFIFILIAYLLGSLSMAIIISRLAHLPDPRTQGSGNPGTTNVLRLGGKKAALIVLAGDILKGLLPVLLAKSFAVSELILAFTGLAAFLGHCYPVFFSFKGGKGVATALGVILGLSWLTGLILIITWILIAAIFRISSLAAIIAAIVAPFAAILLLPAPELMVMVFVMATMLIWRHRGNLYNLFKGIEPKIGK